MSEEKPGFGVGMPASVLLDHFGRIVFEAFGEIPYLVGSATRSKTWRDVDVRLILPDDEFERIFGGKSGPRDRFNLRWALVCGSIARYGQQITGLPIDFQIQSRTEADKEDGCRMAIGLSVTPQPWERETPA